MPVKFLTLGDVAALLQISPRTAWKRAKQGKIPAFLMGDEYRVHPQVFSDWQDKQAGLPIQETIRRGRKRTDYNKTLSQQYPDVFTDNVH